jgi:hypothetical protein
MYRHPFKVFLVVVIFQVFFLSAVAFASKGINSQTYSPSQSSSFFHTRDARADLNPKSPLNLNFTYNFMEDPLIAVDPVTGERRATLLEDVQTLDVGVSYRLVDQLSVRATFPLHAIRESRENHSFGLGDIHLEGTWSLIADGTRPFGIALNPEILIPSGRQDLNIAGGKGAGLRVAGSWDTSLFRLGGDVGYRYQPNAVLRGLNLRHNFLASGGVSVPVFAKFNFSTELTSQLSPSPETTRGWMEWISGMRYQAAQNFELHTAIGLRGIESRENGHFRVIAGLRFSPEFGPQERVIDRISTGWSAPVRCEAQVFSKTFPVRPFSENDFERWTDLPYLPSGKKMQVLQIGQMTAMREGGIPSVQDSQVVFSFDLSGLPDRESVIDIQQASLRLNLVKVSMDEYEDTEMICLLNQSLCSGRYVQSGAWRDLINPVFKERSKRVNDHFLKTYLDSRVETRGTELVYASEITFPLGEFLASHENPIDLLYSEKEGEKVQTLGFVITDDTYVSARETELVLQMTYEKCHK